MFSSEDARPLLPGPYGVVPWGITAVVTVSGGR